SGVDQRFCRYTTPQNSSTPWSLLRYSHRLSMLTLSGITKAFGGRVLFSDSTLQVNRGDRIGLVGPNGAGKTTLFSIIQGEETADEGKLFSERGISIGYLPQESAAVGDETVLEVATAITPEFTRLRRILKAWEA